MNIRNMIYSLSVLPLIIAVSYSSVPDFDIKPIFNKKSYTSGDTVVLALQCRIPRRHHLYGNPLGPGIGKPLKITVNNRNQIKWINAKKSPAEKYEPDIDQWVWAYEKNATFFVIGIVALDAKDPVKDTILFDALICENSCIEIKKSIPVSIAITDNKVKSLPFTWKRKLQKIFSVAEDMSLDNETEVESTLNLRIDKKLAIQEKIPEWDYSPREKEFRFNILIAIILAFFAGIILNVMPCVLPVLGIKILSFSQGKGSSKAIAVISSLAFSTGMISIFIVLASLAAFAGFSWGEQFQKPFMLSAIVCIIFVFALGMFDLFIIIIPTNLTALEHKGAMSGGLKGEFVKGMFATILATPCSGPLLGAILAWTLTQPPIIIYIVFISIGIGMAFPYILFASSTRLLKLIPKPGAWMEDFKHFMGFFLFGFAVYLMIGLQPDMILPTVGLCVFLALALMFYGRWAPFGSASSKKISIGIVSILIVFLGWYVNFNMLHHFISPEVAIKAEEDSGKWENFSVEKLINAHANGKHVMVDFTANWCMNCQFNKIAVFHSKEVNELIKEKNILPLKGDLTRENPAVESLMHHLGSRSVPFFAIFPGDDPYCPVIMRDIVNKKDLLRILRGLAEK